MGQHRREFEYFILRYVPDAVREEFMNVGVILRETLPASGKRLPFKNRGVTMSVLDDLAVLRGIDPHLDLELVRKQLDHLRNRIEIATKSRTSLASYKFMVEIASYSNSLVLSPPRALSAYDPDEALQRLCKMFLG